MADIKKIWIDSLSFLDNSYIYASILIILFLYSTLIFENINNYIGSLYSYVVVRLIVLLLIIYVAPKDITIAIFLAISFLVTINNIPAEEKFDDGTVASKTIQDMLDQGMNGYSPKEIKNLVNENIDNYYQGAKEFSNSLKKHPNMVDDLVRDLAKDPKSKSKSTIESFEGEPDDDQSQDGDDHFETYEDAPDDQSADDQSQDDQSVDTTKEGFYASSPSTCNSFYVPKYESINDVCNPVSTFNNNSYNAQGINDVMGFEKWRIKGSNI